MNDLGQAITNNVAAIVMASLFIWYLRKRDEASSKRDNDFNIVIREFADKLQGLSDALHSLEQRVNSKQ